VKNTESQTLAGVSVIRISFQPNVRIDSAIAQVTAVSQTILRRMPPGAQPPTIIRYNASSVPIFPVADEIAAVVPYLTSDASKFRSSVCRLGILRQRTWSFPNATGEADRVSMKSLTNGGQMYEQND
jgi:hypothetical protein